MVSNLHGSETLRWRPARQNLLIYDHISGCSPIDRAWSADGVGASIDIALREYIHVENPLASRSPFRLAADRLTGEAHVLFDRDFADYVVLKRSGVRRPYIKKFEVRLRDGDGLASLDTIGYDPNFVPLEISNVAGPPCSLVGSVADEGDISYLPDDAPSNGLCTEFEEEDWLVKALTVVMEGDNATDLELMQALHTVHNKNGTGGCDNDDSDDEPVVDRGPDPTCNQKVPKLRLPCDTDSLEYRRHAALMLPHSMPTAALCKFLQVEVTNQWKILDLSPQAGGKPMGIIRPIEGRVLQMSCNKHAAVIDPETCKKRCCKLVLRCERFFECEAALIKWLVVGLHSGSTTIHYDAAGYLLREFNRSMHAG